MRYSLLRTLLTLCGLSLTPAGQAQTIISTLPDVDLAFGYRTLASSVTTFGQTFVAPGIGTTNFDAFEFILQRFVRNTPLTLTAHVAAYNEATQQITGPVFTSSGTNYYDNAREALRFRVPMRQTTLTGGQKYIAFASVQSQGNYFWHMATNNPYSGGDMVYNGNVLAGGTEPWRTFTLPGASAPADLGTRLFFDMPYYSNVAQGKTVSLNGTFGSNASLASSLTDGNYLPQGTQWQSGTVWWTNNNASAIIDMGGLYTINALNIQADDNDAYLVEYRASASDTWTALWTVGNVGTGPDGMQTRPDEVFGNARYFLPTSIFASQFRLRGDSTSSDGLYALSEFRAYGFVTVPEPGTFALLIGTAIPGALILRRRRK